MNTIPRPEPSRSEPILVSGASATAAVVAVIALLRAFGIAIDVDTETAIIGVAGAVAIPALTWFLARQRTVTVDAANQAIAVAHDTDSRDAIALFNEGKGK